MGLVCLTYLSVGDSPVSILVNLLYQLTDFLFAHVKSPRFNQASQLLLANVAIVIEVATDEGFIEVEAWAFIESLSEAFRIGFNLEVGSPHILEFNLGFA